MKLLNILVCLVFLPALVFARLNVVATTTDFSSIAAEIGGDRIDVTALARPTEDPHFVDAKPSFIAKLNRADAIIEGGAELESGWLPPLLAGARNARLQAGAPGRIACATGVEMLDVPATLDRSKGDIHAAGNPHFMVDPMNGKIAAATICNALCALDSSSSDYFRDNLARFNQRIDAKMIEWSAKLHPHQSKHLVAYHNTWAYFSRRFGVEVDVFLEPKPGIPPTPAHLAGVMTRMTDERIRVILCEPYQNRKTAQTVAERTGATVIDVAQFPGGIKGQPVDYIGLIDYLVESMAGALAENRAP